MSHTTSTNDRSTEWRDQAACQSEDPDLWFPPKYADAWLPQIDQAKNICRACPVLSQCRDFALTERLTDGIFGALTPNERYRALRNRLPSRVRNSSGEPIPSWPRPASLQEAVDRRLQPVEGGHALLRGDDTIKFGGKAYGSRRIAFELGHKRKPQGLVRPTCDEPGCHAWQHLGDRVIRAAAAPPRVRRRVAVCGTDSGYAKHLREKTPVCDACRRAHSEADARLRRTGTSRQVAV
ncbi:WhiB family transcriptional regulator [Streptomyces sp. RK31]|uniref:WhiB family transcriptional regulator n=1 Tax=Streptomyces sp. RK31 TaxID=2824892 RepID=UPI001B385872|nr:WhiB family transcriptional regulator [Streptomyces sp. RK31]MBQ0974520.1 WhiB family transcriptional regulator [Streptomyces sp. RK31]